MPLDPSQQRAVDLMTSARLCVITGGPGTGKSTTLREALNWFDAHGITYRLASPTGKAAKRMQEATGREASTLHMLLGIGRDGKRRPPEPIDADAVVIDEASMLDVELAATLSEAIKDHTRVVLIGDANQLPSVGPGRVLVDLINAGVPTAWLTHVHRAAAESWVCRNAPRVLAGEKLELQDFPDFRYFRVDSAEDAARVVADVVSSDEFRGAQVLAPQRTAACGVTALNVALQERLNPRRSMGGEEWKIRDTTFRVGDRVIQTMNDYNLEVFNGEVGEIREIDGDVMTVDFGDRKVAYQKKDALNMELAYALTVHKSQGSEFPWVVCVVHSSHTHMLTRQLFYTAITRAKKGVILVGNDKGLSVATSAKDPPARNTGLADMMREFSVVPSTFAPKVHADNENAEQHWAAVGDDLNW